MERWISALGLFSMVGVAWLLSSHRRCVPWRVVGGGLFLQFALGLLVLKTTLGQSVFVVLGRFFQGVLDYVDVGSEFVFGEGFGEHFIAFKVLPTIIFFSSFMSILYYLGIVQRLVSAMAWLMQRTLGTSGAESLAAAANVFVGQTEAPLVVRPYISGMTQSELMSLMVGGFATIAGGVLAAYVGMGISAEHLLTASVISAPAALLIAKVLEPEVDRPETLGQVQLKVERTATNLIEAAANGAADGLKLALNVGAMLIAFVALIAMANACVGWIGSQFNYVDQHAWTIEKGLGFSFYPFAWLMGIPEHECPLAGQLLGTKIVVNEFFAYERLGEIVSSGSELPEIQRQLSQRSVTILTYAMCGFANFASIGIQLAGIGGVAPERKTDLARLGLRAMIGGNLAAFMTACVASLLL